MIDTCESIINRQFKSKRQKTYELIGIQDLWQIENKYGNKVKPVSHLQLVIEKTKQILKTKVLLRAQLVTKYEKRDKTKELKMTDKDQKDFDMLNKTIKLCRSLIFCKRSLIKKNETGSGKNKGIGRVIFEAYRMKKL